MKKSPKHDFYRIFVRAITLWKHFCSTKNRKSWKRVFTLPRAHQNQIFHEMFRVLALDARPKWWFSFFLENVKSHCLGLAKTYIFQKISKKLLFFSFFVSSGRKHTEQTIFNFSSYDELFTYYNVKRPKKQPFSGQK